MTNPRLLFQINMEGHQHLVLTYVMGMHHIQVKRGLFSSNRKADAGTPPITAISMKHFVLVQTLLIMDT